jgi:hypothetical protein
MGRRRAGATITAHRARDMAAVAWPLGQELGLMIRLGVANPRGAANNGFSTCVVAFAPNMISPTMTATRGRRRISATMTGIAARYTYGFGLHSWATKLVT